MNCLLEIETNIVTMAFLLVFSYSNLVLFA